MESRRRLVVLAILLLSLVALWILVDGGPLSSPGPSRPEEGDSATGSRGSESTAPAETEGGIVEGRVERRGRGVPARVEVRLADRRDRGPVVATADAGPDGRFRIPGLTPGRYEVRAIASDRAAGEAFASIAAPGVRVRVRIEVPGGEYTVAARAVWANGGPFRGLVRGTAWIETRPDGRFLIRGLERGTHKLVFLLPECFRSSGHQVVVPTRREHVFVVDAGAGGVKGRVVAARGGAPIADARVTAWGRNPLFTAAQRVDVRTDREGRFHVRLPAKSWGGRVEAVGYRPTRFFPEGSEDVVIRLDRAHRVTGRVETEKGEAVAGVPVFAVPAGDFVRVPTARAVSGEDGRYVLEGVNAEDVVVYARGGGWISLDLARALTRWYAPLARSLTRGTDAEVRLVVVKAAAIEGTVTDPDGHPVAGALVNGVPWFEGGIPESYAFRQGIRSEVATDPNGRFRMGDAVPGLQHDLTVTAPGFLPAKVRTSAPPVGGAVGAEIVLRAGSDLRVLAVWAGSEDPVVGAVVRGETENWPHFRVEANGTTDEDGRARIGPLPGDARIRLTGRHPEGVRPGPGTILPNGPPEAEIRLVFGRGLPLTGRVLMPDGTPVPHGRVQVWTPANRHYAPISAGGRFRVADLPPGRFRVTADTERDGVRFAATIDASPGEDEVEITLAAVEEKKKDRRPLIVRILDPEGRPVPRAETTYVDLNGRENEPGQGWIQAYRGIATIHLGADCQRYWLAVYNARTFSGAPLPLGRVLLGPLTQFEGDLEIRLPREMTIEGVVVDESGRGMSGANVGYHGLRDQGSSMHIPMRRVFADDAGRFRIGGLGAGEYIVQTGVDGLLPAKAVVRAGATDAVLLLRNPVSARIRVIDAEGAAVKGTKVRAIGSWFGDRSGVTNAEGVAVLDELAAGRLYALRVDGSPGTSIDPWSPENTTVRLPPSLGVAGRVVDEKGKPVPDAEVWCRAGRGEWIDTSAGEDGRFSFGGLPKGPVTLIARFDGAEPVSSDSRAVRVAAGAKDVRLVCRPGVTLRVRIAEWPADRRRSDAFLIGRTGETAAYERVEEDGTVEFADLDGQGVYALWIPAIDDGRTLLHPGLRPGPKRHDLELEPGGLIRGIIHLRQPVEEVEVRLEGAGIELEATRFADGRFEIAGVPSGSFRVVAEGRLDGGPVRVAVPARRGETIELSIGE